LIPPNSPPPQRMLVASHPSPAPRVQSLKTLAYRVPDIFALSYLNRADRACPSLKHSIAASIPIGGARNASCLLSILPHTDLPPDMIVGGILIGLSVVLPVYWYLWIRGRLVYQKQCVSCGRRIPRRGEMRSPTSGRVQHNDMFVCSQRYWYECGVPAHAPTYHGENGKERGLLRDGVDASIRSCQI
jgi:hypothetical protein